MEKLAAMEKSYGKTVQYFTKLISGYSRSKNVISFTFQTQYLNKKIIYKKIFFSFDYTPTPTHIYICTQGVTKRSNRSNILKNTPWIKIQKKKLCIQCFSKSYLLMGKFKVVPHLPPQKTRRSSIFPSTDSFLKNTVTYFFFGPRCISQDV